MNRKQTPDGGLGLVWGADAVARELSVNRRRSYFLLETGQILAKKVGERWCTTREALRLHFADVLVTSGAA